MRQTPRMAEDWRVSVTLEEHGTARSLMRALHEREAKNELKEELGGRVAVSSDGPTIFLYANTRAAAAKAEEVLRETLAEHELEGEPRLDRWHPIEERWEDAAVPLPASAAERELEERRHEDAEDAEGVAEWEVRIELDRHSDAVALAEELEDEGLAVVRRWTYLLIGTATREEAVEIADRIEREAPLGARVQVEPGLAVVWELMPRNPFAVFGGLGQ
jgi:hypothetical protein